MAEVAGSIAGGDQIDRLTDGGLQGFLGSCPQPPEIRLELAERVLNWVEVGRVTGKEDHPTAGRLNGSTDRRLLMHGEIVHDDELPRTKRGDEDVLHIDLEARTIRCPIEQHGGTHPLQGEGGEEGQVLVVVAWG